ncbi:DUF1660 family phage protein [Zhouia sp. PK063]|uniref:DUF1660 family phage protein n=1 Tax=Zhouia sp. PK063 TaxID=3373602 RepID=UPI0037933383
MSNLHPQKPSFFKLLVCKFFGHRFRTTKKITSHVEEYRCTRCNCELTTDDNGKLTYLTEERKEINETLALFYEKRYAQKAS